MKKHLLFLLFLLPLFLAAQTEPRAPQRRSYNNVFAEAWGVTGWYSVNYERIFWRSKRNIFIASGSVGYYNLAYKEKWVMTCFWGRVKVMDICTHGSEMKSAIICTSEFVINLYITDYTSGLMFLPFH